MPSLASTISASPFLPQGKNGDAQIVKSCEARFSSFFLWCGWVGLVRFFFSLDGFKLRGGGGGEVVMLIKDIAWQWMRVSFLALMLYTLIKDIALQ